MFSRQKHLSGDKLRCFGDSSSVEDLTSAVHPVPTHKYDPLDRKAGSPIPKKPSSPETSGKYIKKPPNPIVIKQYKVFYFTYSEFCFISITYHT